MKPYLLSLGIGVVVGLTYSLTGVRSPAPPIIALVGLLGMLIGEQALPLGKRLLRIDYTAEQTTTTEQRRPAELRDLPPD